MLLADSAAVEKQCASFVGHPSTLPGSACPISVTFARLRLFLRLRLALLQGCQCSARQQRHLLERECRFRFSRSVAKQEEDEAGSAVGLDMAEGGGRFFDMTPTPFLA